MGEKEGQIASDLGTRFHGMFFVGSFIVIFQLVYFIYLKLGVQEARKTTGIANVTLSNLISICHTEYWTSGT